MGKLQRSDQLTTPPVIGQRYLVPTVAYPWFGKVDAWPVMGPKHTDAEHIGFEPEHYHVDIRFLSEAQSKRIEKASYGRHIADVAASNPLATRGGPEHPAPTLKRLTCRSDAHHYPSWGVRRQHWYPRLVGAYAGRRCGKNAEGLLVCPHKGFVLSSLQRDSQGRVVCPLHGLVIDMSAEAVIDSTGGARG